MTIKVSKSENYVSGQSFKISGNPAAGGVGIGKSYSGGSGGGGGGGGGGALQITWLGSPVSYEPGGKGNILTSQIDIGTLTSGYISTNQNSSCYVELDSDYDPSAGASPHHALPFNLADHYVQNGIPVTGGTVGHDFIAIRQNGTNQILAMLDVPSVINSAAGNGDTFTFTTTKAAGIGGGVDANNVNAGIGVASPGYAITSRGLNLNPDVMTSAILSSDNNSNYTVSVSEPAASGLQLPLDLTEYFTTNGFTPVGHNAPVISVYETSNPSKTFARFNLNGIFDWKITWTLNGQEQNVSSAIEDINTYLLASSFDINPNVTQSAIISSNQSAGVNCTLTYQEYPHQYLGSTPLDLAEYLRQNGIPTGGSLTFTVTYSALNITKQAYFQIDGIVDTSA